MIAPSSSVSPQRGALARDSFGRTPVHVHVHVCVCACVCVCVLCVCVCVQFGIPAKRSWRQIPLDHVQCVCVCVCVCVCPVWHPCDEKPWRLIFRRTHARIHTQRTHTHTHIHGPTHARIHTHTHARTHTSATARQKETKRQRETQRARTFSLVTDLV